MSSLHRAHASNISTPVTSSSHPRGRFHRRLTGSACAITPVRYRSQPPPIYGNTLGVIRNGDGQTNRRGIHVTRNYYMKRAIRTLLVILGEEGGHQNQPRVQKSMKMLGTCAEPVPMKVFRCIPECAVSTRLAIDVPVPRFVPLHTYSSPPGTSRAPGRHHEKRVMSMSSK